MTKKKNLSELAQQKRGQTKKSLNPFEVHINRDKQNVLGRRGKADRGLPGVARTKAINKRKKTLLLEYKLKNKANVFLDKRIGEKNIGMSQEERAMARFAAERMKVHKKKDIFNLNDEEVLTHRGQTLEEIEKFDDPKSDDDYSDDEDKSGKLKDKFVEEAHFGGGILSKSDSNLSRKDLIEQLIAESKKRKAEKQKIREQTMDLTEKLDSEWKDLLPIVSASKKSNDDPVEKFKTDDYDIAVRELKFEARGMPTDKLKSEEELIREEREKLEKLEEDRLARMKGFVDTSNDQVRHKSADDLDDGFFVEEIAEEEPGMEIETEENDKKTSGNDDQEENDEGKEESVESVEENIEENLNTKKTSKGNKNIEEELSFDKDEEEEEEEEEQEEEEEENQSSAEDNLSDLKESESSSEDEESRVKTTIKLQKSNEEQSREKSKKERETVIRIDLLKRKEIMEKARKELPYTFKAPESYEELQKLLENHNAEYQSVIIDRIIKCNHWSLDGKNKEKLSNLFLYLLQHINDCATIADTEDAIKCFQIFDRICPYLYDLTHMNPENAKTCMQAIIKEKHEVFEKNKKKYPDLDTLIFFKLVSLLFPTSDFRHPVVTPCLIFMSQILLGSRVKTRRDVSKGILICTLILEYTILSKRFSPSVINYLRGIIFTATPKHLLQGIKVIPPFKTIGERSNLLVIEEDQNDYVIDPTKPLMRTSDLVEDQLDDDFRLRVFVITINLINEFKEQLKELESAYSIFEPIFKLLKLNKAEKYPKNIRKHVKSLQTELDNLREKKLEYIIMEKKKPKPLRLYEPRIETVYDGKKHKPMSKEKAEREKLLHKYKKEMKGAIREIRRDRSFLAKVQIKQQIKSDAERKRKVKEIFGEAAAQQSELKKMRRKK